MTEQCDQCGSEFRDENKHQFRFFVTQRGLTHTIESICSQECMNAREVRAALKPDPPQPEEVPR